MRPRARVKDRLPSCVDLRVHWRRLGWLLLTRRVDVLHLHVGDGGSFYRHTLYLALGRLARMPVVFHWHLPGDAGAATKFMRPAARRGDG